MWCRPHGGKQWVYLLARTINQSSHYTPTPTLHLMYYTTTLYPSYNCPLDSFQYLQTFEIHTLTVTTFHPSACEEQNNSIVVVDWNWMPRRPHRGWDKLPTPLTFPQQLFVSVFVFISVYVCFCVCICIRICICICVCTCIYILYLCRISWQHCLSHHICCQLSHSNIGMITLP